MSLLYFWVTFAWSAMVPSSFFCAPPQWQSTSQGEEEVLPWGLPQLFKYQGFWYNHFLSLFPQDSEVHLIALMGASQQWTCAALSSLESKEPNLLQSVGFFLPVSAFAFCDSGSVAGELMGEDWGKKVIEYLSFTYVSGHQISNFLSTKAYIFPTFPFVTNLTIEAFPFVLDLDGLVLSGLLLS